MGWSGEDKRGGRGGGGGIFIFFHKNHIFVDNDSWLTTKFCCSGAQEYILGIGLRAVITLSGTTWAPNSFIPLVTSHWKQNESF